MGKYSQIKEARTSEGGIYFLPGVYKVQVLRVKEGKTRKGDDFVVVESKILESSNPERPAGLDVGWMLMLKQDMAMINLKQFLQAALDEENVTEDDVLEAIGEDNPLAGLELGVQASTIQTRSGNPFTKVTWKKAA